MHEHVEQLIGFGLWLTILSVFALAAVGLWQVVKWVKNACLSFWYGRLVKKEIDEKTYEERQKESLSWWREQQEKAFYYGIERKKDND